MASEEAACRGGAGVRAREHFPDADFIGGKAFYYSVRVDISTFVAGFAIRDHSDVEVAQIAYFSGQRERRATINWQGQTWVVRSLPTWVESAELLDGNGLVHARFCRMLNGAEYIWADSERYVVRRRSLFSMEFDVLANELVVGELRTSRRPFEPRCLVVSESVPWPLRLFMLAMG